MDLSKADLLCKKVVPLWRSKRFLASLAVALVLGVAVFWLFYLHVEIKILGTKVFLPLLLSFTLFSLLIVFLPRFIVQIGDLVQGLFSNLVKKVIEEFLKERARRRKKESALGKARNIPYKKVVLDTSAIIDGRFLEVVRLGFMEAEFIVPQCVLNELRGIADSKDDLRRIRGRRGLDVLKKLKKVRGIKVKTPDYKDKYGKLEVDKQLTKICKRLKAELMTVDFNLNKVSDISGTKVLNINELVNAIKAPVIPGEVLSIRLVQEGKSVGQAVGYLEDGTMVVVEGGSKFLGKKITVTVSRLLQTPAGQMIFATPT
ncbi:MAG: TRAM domain-containing protein [bacterium]